MRFISSLLFCCGTILLFARGARFKEFHKSRRTKAHLIGLTKFLSVFVFTFSMMNLITRSTNISLPVSLIVSYFPIVYRRQKIRKEAENRRKSWPLVIDQLSTATASGVSLHMAVIEMATRGPQSLHEEFNSFEKSFKESGSLAAALNDFVKAARNRGTKSHTRMAAQLKSTILIARDYGGQEIGPILRNLSMHLRNRERALDEIAIRQNWIKNGAALASLTPWLLLLVLSLHSQTVAAYNSSAGRIVLFIGLAITIVAYKWISKISDSFSIE